MVSTIVDYYPVDPSVYEENFHGLSVGCDLLTAFSGDEGNYFLRIVFSWGGLGTAQLFLMM